MAKKKTVKKISVTKKEKVKKTVKKLTDASWCAVEFLKIGINVTVLANTENDLLVLNVLGRKPLFLEPVTKKFCQEFLELYKKKDWNSIAAHPKLNMRGVAIRAFNKMG